MRQVILDDIALAPRATRDGLGIVNLLEGYVRTDLDEGRQVRALEDYYPPFPGYHLYHPSRCQLPRAMRLLVGALGRKASSPRSIALVL